MPTADEVLNSIEALIASYKAPPPPPPPPLRTRVLAGGNLQAALDARGEIELEAGATFEGRGFVFRPGTLLLGNGATLRANGGPALFVEPGFKGELFVDDLNCASAIAEVAPVQLGALGTAQRTLDAVPSGRIRLQRVNAEGYRGKRGFSLHSADTDLIECTALDFWVTGRDSQPWWIHNTPGRIKILGGKWSAGAELALFGGDDFHIPGLVPADVEVGHGAYFRPLEWATNLADEEVKCGLEVKNGERIWFHHLAVDGCWQDSQPLGAAFQFTPTRGGTVRDIRVEDCDVVNSADLCTITGRDTDAATVDTQTTGIVFRRVRAKLQRAVGGGFGTGRGALVQRNVGTVEFEACVVESDGTRFAEFLDQTSGFRLVNSYVQLGKYGLTFAGWHASVTADPTRYNVDRLEVTGNRFTGIGATALFLRRFPDNSRLSAEEFAAAAWPR